MQVTCQNAEGVHYSQKPWLYQVHLYDQPGGSSTKLEHTLLMNIRVIQVFLKKNASMDLGSH